MTAHVLDDTVLARLRDSAVADPLLTATTNAVTSNDIDTIALDREKALALGGEPEIKLDRLPVTDQQTSGRCWMFAGFNAVRHSVSADLNLESFEFSQAFLHFYDKLEKANYALTTLASLENPDDRLVTRLLEDSAADGGMFSFYAALIAKYGAVPQSVMPDPHSATDTRAASQAVRTIVRRAWLKKIPTEEAMADVHRVVAMHLGTPPHDFRFTYRDKDDHFHDEGVFTPRQFAEKHLDSALAEMMELAYDPRPDHDFGRAYTIEHVTNMVEAPTYRFVNADMPDLITAAQLAVRGGQPVWFACDVNTQFSPLHMLWDRGLIATDDIYGIDTSFARADQVVSRNLAPTHGMVLTGYDPTSGIWRVENSWGTKTHKGQKLSGEGYGAMTTDWFADNVFSIVLPKRFVPQGLQDAWSDPNPQVLPFYDPMY